MNEQTREAAIAARMRLKSPVALITALEMDRHYSASRGPVPLSARLRWAGYFLRRYLCLFVACEGELTFAERGALTKRAAAIFGCSGPDLIADYKRIRLEKAKAEIAREADEVERLENMLRVPLVGPIVYTDETEPPAEGNSC